jgi:hypothetical protein
MERGFELLHAQLLPMRHGQPLGQLLRVEALADGVAHRVIQPQAENQHADGEHDADRHGQWQLRVQQQRGRERQSLPGHDGVDDAPVPARDHIREHDDRLDRGG